MGTQPQVHRSQLLIHVHSDLEKAVAENFDTMRAALEDLVRIPSVSAAEYDPSNVRMSAEAVSDLLVGVGFQDVRLLELEGAHPAVFGQIPTPDGAPTVLLYAHHDVQPPGPPEEWETAAFEPEERGGRLFGRGSSDDKSGIVLHLGAVAAHKGQLPVGVKMFVEGEEEIGSLHLDAFLSRHGAALEADCVVIADSGNWRTGMPSVTTSLRGLVDCYVEVRTLDNAVHSGEFGGALPDALTTLCRTLSSLHDDQGRVAIAGLRRNEARTLDLTDEELLQQANAVPGVELIGEGPLTSRLWQHPAVSVVALDAPPVAEAINQLIPVARAKVSLRLAPGDDPERAMEALTAHLEAHTPWGAAVTVERGAAGKAFELDTTGAAYDAWRQAFTIAWDTEPVEIGVGGSIPFVAAFAEQFPNASILLTGVGDHLSRAHGPNESLDLGELRRGTFAEAIALRLLAK